MHSNANGFFAYLCSHYGIRGQRRSMTTRSRQKASLLPSKKSEGLRYVASGSGALIVDSISALLRLYLSFHDSRVDDLQLALSSKTV